MRYLLLTSVLLSSFTFAENMDKPRVLLLAGGHLPVCSSVNLNACPKEMQGELAHTFEKSFARMPPRFRVDEVRLRFVESTPLWPASDESLRAKTLKQLQNMNRTYSSAHEFLAALGPLEKQLSDDAISLLQDVMEADQIDDKNQVRREQVKLAHSSEEVQQIWRSFIHLCRQQSGQQTPLIGLITAASHDALGSVDYLTQTIEQAGGKAIWIGVEPRWDTHKANTNITEIEQRRQRETGAFFRARHYPAIQQIQNEQLMNRAKLISQIHALGGIFFGGGDQSLLLRSLFSDSSEATPELLAIQQTFAQAKLVIGGTSAGTAVQSGGTLNRGTEIEMAIPMISNGTSAQVFELDVSQDEPMLPFCSVRKDCPKSWHADQLSYRPQGGLGFFDAGVLDTHFSERARAGRLVLLLEQNRLSTKSHKEHTNAVVVRGFGVDETTALINFQYADRSEFGVIGRRGVWVAENYGHGRYVSHYLRHGDQAQLQQNRLTVQLNGCLESSANNALRSAGAPLTKATLLTRYGAHEASLQLSAQTPILDIALHGQLRWQYQHNDLLHICAKGSEAWSYRDLAFQLYKKSP